MVSVTLVHLVITTLSFDHEVIWQSVLEATGSWGSFVFILTAMQRSMRLVSHVYTTVKHVTSIFWDLLTVENILCAEVQNRERDVF